MKVSILGSTGSIGTQTLEVLAALGASPVALTGNKNIKLLEQQARKYRPKLVAAPDAKDLRIALADTDITVSDNIEDAACHPSADTVLTALVGSAGLRPTVAAIRAGKTIALANKETLVVGGEFVTAEAERGQVRIIPVDSEHSAIFQCLDGRNKPRKLWLTASGGPFFGLTRDQMQSVTPEMALKHPNWNMGPKVTVDSATMFNKGLEMIEARHLFGLNFDDIRVVVHRQSIVHSMVEFADGAIIAQCGKPDMRLPIQYALTYPSRAECPTAEKLDMSQPQNWTFEPPDRAAFPCLDLAAEAGKKGPAACAALNAADEAAVEKFLRGEIGFLEIPAIVEKAVSRFGGIHCRGIDDLLNVEREVLSCLR